MCSLLLDKHGNPISLRSALEHDIDFLSVTLTSQPFLELIIVYFEGELLLKSLDYLVNVQNLA